MTGDNTTLSLIEGKVAKLLNDREVVMNRGLEHSVEPGMKFKIMEDVETVIDPETNEEIGNISREKIRVKIVHIEPKLSICRTYETYYSPGGLWQSGAVLNRLFEQPEVHVRTLRTDVSPVNEADSIVHVGDRMIQITDEE